MIKSVFKKKKDNPSSPIYNLYFDTISITREYALGRKDSNPRMAGPKPGALPLGHAPFRHSYSRLIRILELHRKDYLSQRDLCKILGKRQRLLSYLSKKKENTL